MKLSLMLLTVTVIGLSTWLGVGHAAAPDLSTVDSGTFKSADLNGDGRISRREILHFGDLAFLSMDANGDEILTVEEFLLWDTGYAHVADQVGKLPQLNEAKRTIYTDGDLNGDGKLGYDEFSVANLYDFYKADRNHDGALSQEEFTREYRILKAMRAVLQ